MTVVTTSRKPAPEIRTLARDMAFSIGAGYVTRGKAGMGDLFSLDESVLIVSKSGPFFLILVYGGGELAAEIRVRTFAVEERTGAIARGLFVSDRPVYMALKDHADTVFAGESLTEHRIVFDGTQRRRYTLKVAS
ncbi:MAG: hypothetical protein GX837_04565 [Methanomicrobiales archaeon]|jgi:U3 small nucleolar ribonucleoprotein protein IMP4|nr:hypothetical protein [Methanomicrobiales archaeon]